MTAIAARARGLGTTVLGGDVLSELDHVRDFDQLVGALARAGVTPPAVYDAETLDRTMRDRIASLVTVPLAARGSTRRCAATPRTSVRSSSTRIAAACARSCAAS